MCCRKVFSLHVTGKSKHTNIAPNHFLSRLTYSRSLKCACLQLSAAKLAPEIITFPRVAEWKHKVLCIIELHCSSQRPMAIPTVAASLKGCVKKGIKSQGCKNTNDLTLLQLHSQEAWILVQ